MDLALYRGPSGAYVVVPACMRPSAEAEHGHGPLRLGMRFPLTDANTDPLHIRMVRDLDSQSYAVLTAIEANDLLEGIPRP